ncbi:Acetyltransferase [Hartmannibacter diazotrophicus]|uniref:Acetyltransferase n=1 Tax=Hartmannibacter diazotrophicus TaxID=1482074 RepID=A0A2C9D2X7_9HYPH|nr:GNAT family N-acetyltransferase [Hartmannibacter diazotrophicus]SON54131.1 Acetyltransferase [Hartmannibacter diazotrophicus]
MTVHDGTASIDIDALSAAEAEKALPGLADLLVDAVRGGASVNFMADISHDDALGFWRGQLPAMRDGMRTLFVAREADGDIVGCVVLTLAPQPNAPYRADIGKMIVHSRARRQGLGRRLLETAERRAFDLGRTLLILDTEAGSAGEALYRRCGWIGYGTVPGYAYDPHGAPAAATFFYKQLA